MENKWHLKSLSEIEEIYGVNPANGLSQVDAEKRKVEFGANVLPSGKKLYWWQLIFRQLNNPLIIILLISAALTFWLDEYKDTTVIMLAVLVNVAIGFWQEYRSNQIFEKLHKLVKVTARVLRDGKLIEAEMSELVPGDIIYIKGDLKIPADARILTSSNLLVNEAILTGESNPVSKKNALLKGNVSIGDRVNMIHMGTFVERGDGTAVVVSTGSKTEIGKIAELTQGVEDDTTPLQERLFKLGRYIATFISVAAVVIFIVGFLRDKDVTEVFTLAVAVAVAAIPEGLPAALSVVLAVSATRILKKKGLVKKLIGAETLGSTSVIVTDKTGTLTAGIMEVKEVIHSKDLKSTARAMALSSDLVLVEGGFRGESTDKAKAEYFHKMGGSVSAALSLMPRVAFLPFDQEMKIIASFHSSGKEVKLFVSGAPESIVALSKVTKKTATEILNEVESYAARGFRMIGVAETTIKNIKNLDFENVDKLKMHVAGLTFLGTAAIRDPIREDVRKSMEETRKAGIRVIMATGDHKLTAVAIGKDLNFSTDDTAVLTGEEVDTLDEGTLSDRLKQTQIFSRVTPAHKMRLVEILKKQGEAVAMTGDGINDAPALRAADIGVALGSGTDVTKEAADLVLLNDSFSIITAAVKQGRIAFDNARKVTVFQLSNAFTEIIIVLAALIFNTAVLPLTAVLILWSNLVENSFPNFALAFEPGEDGIMEKPPRERSEPILDKLGLTIIFTVGIIADFIMVGIFFYLLGAQWEEQRLQTMMFGLLAINSFFIVFAVKSYVKSIFRTKLFDNKYLLFSVLAGMVMLAAAIYFPPLQHLLGTTSLSLNEILFILAMGAVQMLMIEGAKWWFRRSNKLGFSNGDKVASLGNA